MHAQTYRPITQVKKYAVAADTPVDLEISKLIHTSPVT